MRLIGLLCVRNEAWILGCSMRAALKWVDELVVVDHNSTDGTFEIVDEVSAENPWRVHYSRWVPTEEKVLESVHSTSRTILNPSPLKTWKQQVPIQDESRWDEQDMRQHSLLLGRKHGGTHFAMIDADEILTANMLYHIREDVSKLGPGEVVDYPLYAMRSLDEYQDDETHWSRGVCSLVFRDAVHLTWKPAADGYHFHSRCPWGTGARHNPIEWRQGGVFHLQFANRRRLVAKHRWYRMVEHIRYPGRMSVAKLNEKYDDALRPPGHVTRVPAHWWADYERDQIDLQGWPWHEGEIHRMIEKHGAETFNGLNLELYVPPPPPTVAPRAVLPPNPPPSVPSDAEIAEMICSDCKASYFAEIVNIAGCWEIGKKVEPPADRTGIRKQRMLCRMCQGKGGPGDKLNNLLRQQRGQMGPGNDPFGLF